MVPTCIAYLSLASSSDCLYRWAETIFDMMLGLPVSPRHGFFVMIDESEFPVGRPHRRPGAHIDGNWTPEGWNTPGEWSPGGHTKCSVRDLKPEAIVLASSRYGCDGYVGDFETEEDFRDGGDCSHFPLEKLKRFPIPAGVAAVGNVTFIHESVPIQAPPGFISIKRQLVRLNIPGWELKA